MEEPEPLPLILSPCGSGRRRSGDSTSPEFEFWMVGNPSFPQPNLLSADELFSDGFLLPLHLLNLSGGESDPIQIDLTHEESGLDRVPEPEPSTTESVDFPATCSLTSSKRWRDIFKKNDKKIPSQSQAKVNNGNGDDRITTEKDNVVKEKKRDMKNGASGTGGVGARAAELNINIWPFARSRSAGNGGTRPRTAATTRKVSSAPCSRSNSGGESKSRKWPSSPSRPGVHLGRSSPVWQVRRNGSGGGGRSSETVVKTMVAVENGVKKDPNEGRRKIPSSGSSKARVLSLNVPMCIGYRHNLSCRSDENSTISIAAAAAVGGGGDSQSVGGIAGDGVRRSNLLNIRSLFTKKVY